MKGVLVVLIASAAIVFLATCASTVQAAETDKKGSVVEMNFSGEEGILTFMCAPDSSIKQNHNIIE